MKDNCNLEWEEIFANEDTDKKFISKTYKEPQIVQYQKHNNPRHKWAKHRNGYFLEEDIGIVIRHMRTCSASLILTQRQIKSLMWYYLTSVRMAISKHLQVCLLHWQAGSLTLVPPGKPYSNIKKNQWQFRKRVKKEEEKRKCGAKESVAILVTTTIKVVLTDA